MKAKYLGEWPASGRKIERGCRKTAEMPFPMRRGTAKRTSFRVFVDIHIEQAFIRRPI
jgi:hypothetical protein